MSTFEEALKNADAALRKLGMEDLITGKNLKQETDPYVKKVGDPTLDVLENVSSDLHTVLTKHGEGVLEATLLKNLEDYNKKQQTLEEKRQVI